MKSYDETLLELGLKKFSIDLAIVDKDIALNGHGNFLLTNPEVDALYNFIQKWRYQKEIIVSLFSIWKQNKTERKHLEFNSRNFNTKERVEAIELIESIKEGESSIAGAIFVLLSTQLKILDREKTNPSKTKVKGCDFREIVNASANNFRHYDEWAKQSPYTNQAKNSVIPLCKLLGITEPLHHKPIIKNICSDSLMEICNLNFEEIERLISSVSTNYQKSIN